MNVNIVKGSINYFDFIIECIIEAELSNSNILSYAKLFNIDIFAVRNLIKEVFLENIVNQPWHFENFYILLINNEPASVCCTWIEPSIGNGYDFTKAQVLMFNLGSKWIESADKILVASEINISRIKLAIQFEYLYTHPKYRGQGLMGLLIKELETQFKNNENTQSQILVMGNNEKAIKLYKSLGYLEHDRKWSNDIRIFEYLPSNFRISLIKNLI